MPRDQVLAMCQQIVLDDMFASKRLIRSKARTFDNVISLKADGTIYTHSCVH